MDDPITHPSHYTTGKIECWDYIVSQNLNFLEGNVVKYVTRWRRKNGLEDLKKARQYLNKLITTEETRLAEEDQRLKDKSCPHGIFTGWCQPCGAHLYGRG